MAIIKIITNDNYKIPLEESDKKFFNGILNGFNISKEVIKNFISDADVLMVASESAMPFDKELIDAAKNVKLISLDTTDYSWIDTSYAKSKGIIVANSPHVCTEAVAEQTIAMILNFSKNIHQAYRDLYLNNKVMKTVLGTELFGKTLGIIGFGDIGTRVYEIARCLGMNILVWNRTKKVIAGQKSVELDYLLENSDFITIHISANKETKNFINQEKIRLMKPSIFIVNLADKTLGNNDDILTALKEKRIAGYCVELWDIKETNEHPIYALENVIAFHGFGWYTKESLQRTFDTWLLNAKKYLQGEIVNSVIP